MRINRIPLHWLILIGMAAGIIFGVLAVIFGWHEFTLNWMARPVPCYLDVALSLPKKKEPELDLNITARTGENMRKIAVIDCLDKIVPALHSDVQEVFNAILTDEALNHCGVKK